MSPHEEWSVAPGLRNSLSSRLIRGCTRLAPPPLAARLEEEWLADLAAQPAPLSRLHFALGCCWAMCVISHEHTVAAAAATPSHLRAHPRSKTMILPSPSLMPRRSAVILTVICLHIALVYLLSTGLGARVINLLPGRTLVDFSEEPRPALQPPPPVTVQMAPVKVDDPVVPDIDIPIQPDAGVNSITPPPTCQLAHCGSPLPPVAPPPVVRVPGRVGKGFPNTEDFYPASSIRLGQEGVAAVQVCVDDKGRLTSDPTLANTSGIAAIDNAALRLARAGSGHYLPSTENGRPVSSCYAFNVHFRLRN